MGKKETINVQSRYYSTLISQIGDLLQQGRKQAAYAVNNVLVQTYWQIGKYIVEYEQGGSKKSEYGSKLLDRLSKDLTLAYGKGFGYTFPIKLVKQCLTNPRNLFYPQN